MSAKPDHMTSQLIPVYLDLPLYERLRLQADIEHTTVNFLVLGILESMFPPPAPFIDARPVPLREPLPSQITRRTRQLARKTTAPS
jgi:hypothetical protein